MKPPATTHAGYGHDPDAYRSVFALFSVVKRLALAVLVGVWGGMVAYVTIRLWQFLAG